MNKKLIIGIIVAVLIIGGGVAAYFMLTGDDNASTNNSQSSNNQPQTADIQNNGEYKGSFNSLVASGKAQHCNMSYSGPNGTGTGETYSDGKGRGIMTVNTKTEQGNTGESNTLVTADKVYTWTKSNGQTFGFTLSKTALTQSDTSTNSSSSSSTQDSQKEFTMNCQSWTVDEAKLTPPSDVTFTALPTTQQ